MIVISTRADIYLQNIGHRGKKRNAVRFFRNIKIPKNDNYKTSTLLQKRFESTPK